MKRLNLIYAKRNKSGRQDESRTVNGRLTSRNVARWILSGLLTLAMTLGLVITVFALTSEEYFVSYDGTYSLSESYGKVYGDYIEGIGDWSITVANGKVTLHTKEGDSEATATTKNITDTTSVTMTVTPPGWDCYTNTKATVPTTVSITLKWSYDKNSGVGYFETTAKTAYVKFNPEDSTAKQVRIPVLHFDRKETTELAKSKLKDYAGEYPVNDGSGEKITIEDDGTPLLHIREDEAYLPLYYNFTKGEVASVAYTAKDWFASAKQTFDKADSKAITMTWDAVSLQFAVSADSTLYKKGSDEISRVYS